jgi:hypothetical protein
MLNVNDSFHVITKKENKNIPYSIERFETTFNKQKTKLIKLTHATRFCFLSAVIKY